MRKTVYRQFVSLALVFCLLPILAYAKKYPLAATPAAPGAKGFVDTKKDKNGNTNVTLKVDFLPKPASLTPPAETYIVWFRKQASEPEAQGQLKVDDNLRGEFKTTANLKNFDVIVTAEKERTPKAPTGPEVLRATVQEQ